MSTTIAWETHLVCFRRSKLAVRQIWCVKGLNIIICNRNMRLEMDRILWHFLTQTVNMIKSLRENAIIYENKGVTIGNSESNLLQKF